MPPAASLALQTSAHCVGLELPGVWSTHAPFAIVPAGTSVGQGVEMEQTGEQKLPLSPVICTCDYGFEPQECYRGPGIFSIGIYSSKSTVRV